MEGGFFFSSFLFFLKKRFKCTVRSYLAPLNLCSPRPWQDEVGILPRRTFLVSLSFRGGQKNKNIASPRLVNPVSASVLGLHQFESIWSKKSTLV